MYNQESSDIVPEYSLTHS